MRFLVVLASLLFANPAPPQQAANPVVQAVVRGMSCKQSAISGQLECEYRVGTGLHFAIAGVGHADAAVTFYKVDWDADYYATVGVGRGHQCVVVKATSHAAAGASMAFVSPRTGRVFGDWKACDQG